MNPGKRVTETLKAIGARLKRNAKHQVWELPNGQTFVRANTPSDVRAEHNNLSDLRHAAGILDPERGKPGERRDRRRKPGRMDTASHVHAAPCSDFAEKLSLSGAVEASLRNEIQILAEQLQRAEAKAAACWWCRFQEWRKR